MRLATLAAWNGSWLGRGMEHPVEAWSTAGSRLSVHFRDGVFLPRTPDHRAECFLEVPPRTLDLSGALGAATIWQLAEAGTLFLHAAALAFRDQVVLALGASGTGKSTLAIAWALAGSRVIGDDTILLAPGRDDWSPVLVEAWRQDAAIRRDALSMLPTGWTQRIKPDPCDADRFWLRRLDNTLCFQDVGRLGAVILLKPSSPRRSRSTLEPTHQADGLATLYAANSHLGGNLLVDKCAATATALRIATTFRVLALEVGTALLLEPVAEVRHIQRLLQDHLRIR
jgi:hypothetical protein